MDHTDLETTLNGLIQEIKDSINRIVENSKNIKNDGSKEDVAIIINTICDMSTIILLVNNLKSLISSITEHIMPKKYICIAKTMEEKINWFLDNKIYESRNPFDPDFDFLMKSEIGVFKLEE